MANDFSDILFGVCRGQCQLYLQQGAEQLWDLFDEHQQPSCQGLLFRSVELAFVGEGLRAELEEEVEMVIGGGQFEEEVA